MLIFKKEKDFIFFWGEMLPNKASKLIYAHKQVWITNSDRAEKFSTILKLARPPVKIAATPCPSYATVVWYYAKQTTGRTKPWPKIWLLKSNSVWNWYKDGAMKIDIWRYINIISKKIFASALRFVLKVFDKTKI